MRGVGKRTPPLGLGLRGHGRHPGVSRKVGAVKRKRGKVGMGKGWNTRRETRDECMLLVVSRGAKCVCACADFLGVGGKTMVASRAKKRGRKNEEEDDDEEEEGVMYE